jgi:hypothetical protein
LVLQAAVAPVEEGNEEAEKTAAQPAKNNEDF